MLWIISSVSRKSTLFCWRNSTKQRFMQGWHAVLSPEQKGWNSFVAYFFNRWLALSWLDTPLWRCAGKMNVCGSVSREISKYWKLCVLCRESCKVDRCRWKRDFLAWKQKSSRCLCQDVIYLKSATKPLNVLIAFTRPLITEFADNLNLKHPLLPTMSPYPTMWLEAIHNIIPISCRHYPKSVWQTSA